MSNPCILTLDCGASHVTALLAEVESSGRLRVVRQAVEPLVLTGEEESQWFAALGQALLALKNRHGFSAQECAVGLPGHLVLTKFVRTPAVERKLRERVVQFEAAQNIPQDLAEVAWGYVEVQDDGTDLELMLAAVKNELMERLCLVVEAAGFRVARAEPASLALARLRRDDPAPGLLVDVGARSTQLVFNGASGFFTRTLGWGSNALTRSLMETLGLDFAAAEEAKTDLERAPGGDAAKAAEAFCDRLALEITRSRLSYSRQPNAVPPERVLLTGAGTRLTHLHKILAEKLGLPVERLQLDIDWKSAGAAAASEDQLAVAVGLAGAAWSPQGSVMNLLPQSRRESLLWRRQLRVWLAVAGLLGLALLPPLAYYRSTNATLAERVRTAEQALRPLRQMETRHLDNQLRLETLTTEIAEAERLVAHRDAWVRFLFDLQARLAGIEDVWLDRLEPDATSGLAAENGERRLMLSGRLLDAANPLAKASGESYAKAKRLMESLRESRFIREVTGERFDNQQAGILRFEVTVVLQPEEPL